VGLEELTSKLNCRRYCRLLSSILVSMLPSSPMLTRSRSRSAETEDDADSNRSGPSTVPQDPRSTTSVSVDSESEGSDTISFSNRKSTTRKQSSPMDELKQLILQGQTALTGQLVAGNAAVNSQFDTVNSKFDTVSRQIHSVTSQLDTAVSKLKADMQQQLNDVRSASATQIVTEVDRVRQEVE